MKFAQGVQSYICPGNSITCEAGPFTVLAQVVRGGCLDAPEFRGSENGPGERFPEGRQDGFWLSLYADAPGLMGEAEQELVRGTNSQPNGPNHRQRFAGAHAKAKAVIEGWRKGDWFYCGIVLSASLEGVALVSHAASLWGIEANDPGTDNSCLAEAANERLP